MSTTKTLMLAAVAALSLGVGTVMADGPDGTSPDYQSARALASAMNSSRTINHDAGQIGSGSSDTDTDTDTKRPGIFFDYGSQQ
jgi:hypothetical protein